MRNVLFLTYYFPPSGGPGVQRSLKFTKYLPEFGWQPTVVTVRPEHASYPDIDPRLVDEIPASVRVEQTSAWDPYALYATMLQKEKQDIVSVGFLGEADMNTRQRLARWVRANLFLPDARVGWVPFAAARGNALIRKHHFDAMLTTGPPHSTHLAGLILRLTHKTPWITDLRDPWTQIDYAAELPSTDTAKRIDRWLERSVLANASTAVVRSVTMGRQVLPTAQTPIKVIENGFDPVDFEDDAPAPSGERFVIRHIGNLNLARNPTSLWEALRNLNARETMSDLRISFVGNVEPAVLATASEYGLRDVVETIEYVPHDEAIRLARETTLLLLSINRVKGAVGVVPGKLYEYVATGRPIIGVGPVQGDAARVLGESNAGQMFDFDDVAGLQTYLRTSYDSWKQGRRLSGASWEKAVRYSRREQTRMLAKELDAIAESK